jgi:LPXTG-motif cell wall-anchored protein
MLVLALVCALPAVSAAQDSGTAGTTTTTTTTPSDTGTPPSESPSSPSSGGEQSDATSAGAAAGTPPEAAKPTSEAATDDRRVEPADAPAGGASVGAHKSASTTVTMGDFFFRPATVTVSVGDIVTWRNEGHEPHTATADDGSFDTGTVPAGGRASHLFTQTGTFSYVCTIHPNMTGTVRVVGSGGGGSSSGSSSSSGSGPTEAQAVKSPNAAGDADTLPMTGMPVVPLTIAGLALLGTGLILRRFARRPTTGRHLPVSSLGSGPSGAQAIDSPDVAGDTTTLATGMAVGALALGLVLLGSALVVRRSARMTARGHQPPFS